MTFDIAQTKCVVVVDETLPTGLAANAASVITMTLGHRADGLVGPDVKDADGKIHAGIVLIPIPILTAPGDRVRQIWQDASAGEALVVGFSALAQSCRTYDEYVEAMAGTATADLSVVGVGIVGPRKMINRFSGSLPLLR